MGEMRQCFMAGGPSKVPIYGRQSWQIKTQDALLNLNFMLTMIFFSMSMSQTLQERPLFYLATRFPPELSTWNHRQVYFAGALGCQL